LPTGNWYTRGTQNRGVQFLHLRTHRLFKEPAAGRDRTQMQPAGHADLTSEQRIACEYSGDLHTGRVSSLNRGSAARSRDCVAPSSITILIDDRPGPARTVGGEQHYSIGNGATRCVPLQTTDRLVRAGSWQLGREHILAGSILTHGAFTTFLCDSCHLQPLKGLCRPHNESVGFAISFAERALHM
jgi:hypothetical protein